MKITKFKVDKNKSTAGVWVFWDADQDMGFLIARTGNNKNRRAVDEATNKRGFQRLDPVLKEQAYEEAAIGTILLDWKGVEDDDGNEFPFNHENALWLFRNCPEIKSFIFEQAGEMSNFREENLKVIEGK